MRLIDMTGRRFGRLTVLKRSGSRHGQAAWLCRCSCGIEKVIMGGNLRNGKTLSCGCQQDEGRRARKGRWMVERPTYLGAHYRVWAHRGRASEHDCGCGAPAEQWAFDHEDPDALWTDWKDQAGKVRTIAYSADPEHYIPMCRRCHLEFDRQAAAERSAA